MSILKFKQLIKNLWENMDVSHNNNVFQLFRKPVVYFF
jgi:hypothetical protein